MNLILSADDFGMSKSVVDGIIYGIKKGFTTSTSILANLEFTDYAIEQAKANGIKAVGIHCNLINGKSLTGNPHFGFTKNDRTSKTVNQQEILGSVTYDEAKAEILAQYDYVVSRGLEINHLDNHMLLETYPNIMRAMIDVAEEKNIPMRFYNRELKKQINAAGVKTPNIICRDFFGNGVKPETLDDLLNRHKNEEIIVEIMTHVAFIDDYTKEFTDYLNRENELYTLEKYLKDGRFEGVNLVSHDIFKE